MNFPRVQIKANARAAFSANYWPIVGILFLGNILSDIVVGISEIPRLVTEFGQIYALNTYGSIDYAMQTSGSVFSFLISIIGMMLSFMFEVGICRFAYNVYSGKEPNVSDLFAGFTEGRFGRVLGGMILMNIYITLWTFLFVIPGIIKTYQYRMVPYLLIDRPDLSIKECFAMSKQMTDGHKFDLFVLDLSFIGWAILAVFTLGILDLFYVGPYSTLAQAGAYDYLKRTRMGYYDSDTSDDVYGRDLDSVDDSMFEDE